MSDILSRVPITPQALAYSLPGALANLASNHTWKYAAHTKLIEDKLLDVASGKINRLMINMPPRAGKSMLVSHYFPAWYLGRYPDKRIILTSYESSFAASWGRKARTVLEEFGEQVFGIKISQVSAAADEWEIAKHVGGMSCAGAGSAITGKGANILIIDDPHKDASEAMSKTIQEKIFDWYKSVAYTRLTPDGAIIIIQTRWNVDDLSGKLLYEMNNEGGEKWEVLSLPALAEENDPLGRGVDEGLWPEGGWGTEKYQKIKQVQTPWIWSALYQQRPALLEGDLIKMSWFNRYREPPAEPEQIVLSMDTANKDKDINDFTVIMTWAEYQDKFYLLDVKRDRMVFPRLVHVTEELIKYKKPHAILIEDKGSGTQLIQHLNAGKLPAPVIAVNPTTDKLTRMAVETPLIEAGRIFLPETASWLLDFEIECKSFPQSLHKDQIDALSMALKFFRERDTHKIEIW